MKPLTVKQRSLSLGILVLLFALIAPVILLYSLGYRLDDEYSLQKTGGIFIHSNESEGAVFVDGEFLKNSGFLIRNTLIQDLVPNKEYKVEVHKDGHQSWVKYLFVYPSIVTEGRVLLLPNEFEKREVFQFVDSNDVATATAPTRGAKPNNPEYTNIVALFASSTKNAVKPVATSTAATSSPEQKSKLEIFFDELAIKNFESLPNLIVDGKEVSWLNNGNITLYWTDDLESIPYYYCGGAERVCVNQITLDWGDDIKRFEYLPGREDVWIVLVKDGIYAVEVDGRTQRNIQTIIKGTNLDFRLTQNDSLIIKEGSRYFEINL
jgi:hypothetical protein